MSNSRSSNRWTGKEIALRSVLAAVALGLGCLMLARSVATVLGQQSLDKAHLIAPDDGQITGRFALKLADPDATARGWSKSRGLARLALRQDPTSVDAIVALGLGALVRQDTPAARRFFKYSESLTSRNFQTQLWAISDSIARDDIPSTLKHYDIALRTSLEASDLLFPVLLSSITDAEIRVQIVDLLRGKPAWGERFLNYVVAHDVNAPAAADLFALLIHAQIDLPDGAAPALVNALISAGAHQRAWALYLALHPGAHRDQIRDPNFEIQAPLPSMFDWVPTNDGNISAGIQPNVKGGGVLRFSAPPSTGGMAVQQMELLPPGNYLFEGQSEGVEQSDAERPYWELNCLDGRELGRIEVPNSKGNNGLFRGHFVVRGDCPLQRLSLNIRPSSNFAGVNGQIDRAQLRELPE